MGSDGFWRYLTGSTAVLTLAIVLAGCGKPPKAPSRSIARLRAHGAAMVTDAYGPLVVDVGKFEADAERRPWSAWWYPTKDTYLFRERDGAAAPLQKYDQYVEKASGHAGGAAEFEFSRLFDPNAVGWEGLCDAWSLASILEPEPTAPVVRNRITFDVGDQKALLVKSYERFEGSVHYGQRYNGDRLSDFGDIAADQFHKFLMAELFEGHRAFIMDKDPGLPVWNTPVYSAQVSVRADPENGSVLHVESWLTGASPFVERYDFVGTLSVSFQYTYDLYGDWGADGLFHVYDGAWTERSLDEHPDFVTAVPRSGRHSSKNLEIDTEVVRAIVGDR